MIADITQPLMMYYSEDYKFYTRYSKEYTSMSNLTSRYCPNNKFIPFQVNRPLSSNSITIMLVDVNGDETDISSLLSPDIKRYSDDTSDYILYYGNSEFTAIEDGRYYLKVTDGGDMDFTSEDFCATANYADGLQIKYWHSNDIGGSTYSNFYQKSYANRIWLNAHIEESGTFEVFQKTTKAKTNISTPYYNVSSPIYEITLSVIDPVLVNTLQFMTMHHNIVITTQEGVEITVDKLSAIVTITDLPNSPYKTAVIKYREDTVQVGNCDNNNVNITDSSEDIGLQLEGDSSGDLQTEDGQALLTEETITS